MAKNSWKTGDQVKLISGGPVMTVKTQGTSSFGEYVSCEWFDKDHKLQHADFEPDTLEPAKKS